MKRVSLMLALAILGLLAAAPAVQAGPSSGFTGEWTAIDKDASGVGDGSLIHLIVGPGANPQILFVDEKATGGICRDQASDYFTSLVKGRVADDLLSGTFVVVKCGTATALIRPAAREFALEWTLLGNDTLVDGFGVTWTRG